MKRFLLFAFVLVFASKSIAASINLDELKNQALDKAQSIFNAFAYDLGAAMSYKSVIPAEPLGLLGFDVGAELTVTQMSRREDWLDVLVPGVASKFSYIPVGKLHAHKGLPFGVDLGLSYGMTVQSIQVVGAEVRYSFVSGNIAIPAVAVRGTYSQLVSSTDLSEIGNSSGPLSLNTKGIELTVSKGFLMLTPYAGIGHIWAQIDPNFDDPVLNELETSSPTYMKYFFGANFNLALLNFAAEFDRTGDANSYSAKIGLRF